MKPSRKNQVLVRLTDEAKARLDELVERWELPAGQLIQSVIVQLSRRKDLRNVIDVGSKT